MLKTRSLLLTGWHFWLKCSLLNHLLQEPELRTDSLPSYEDNFSLSKLFLTYPPI